jgi:hypothetical protein
VTVPAGDGRPAMPPLFHWWTLELAFGHVAPGHHSFLDRTTGEVLALRDGVPDDEALRRRIAGSGDRFLFIDPVPPREQYGWMAQFAATIASPELRGRLEAVLDRPGSFRLFKDTLQAYPEERVRWFRFRAQALRKHVERWLTRHGVAHDVQAAPAPADDPLRRQAREMLERLSERDLPYVITYLLQLDARRDLPSQ